MVNRLSLNRNTSFSTSDLDNFSDLSTERKLGRLSKAYSLTDLTKLRPRRSSSAAERTFDKQTLSSKSKEKEVELKKKTLKRITQNIEKDRNSEKKFTKAYQDRFKGIVRQTMSRDTKKRDSAVLSAGRSTSTRLPPIQQSQKVTKLPADRSKPAPADRSKPAPADRNRQVPAGRSKPREPAKPTETTHRKPAAKVAPNAAKVAPAAAKARTTDNSPVRPNRTNRFANVASRVTVVNRALAGARKQPVDDIKLNKKYNSCVCEPCRMQIHEKLKRGYAKYKSLEKMKACEKCKRLVIDFDFYVICVECSKEANVCAKCAIGSTKMSGAKFVEVVRSGVEENLLGMSDKELQQFAQKHAKIGSVERQISFISELEPSSKSRTPSSASSTPPSSRGSSARSHTSESGRSKREQKAKVANKARSLTSSSSPLGDVSETEDGAHVDRLNYDQYRSESGVSRTGSGVSSGRQRSRAGSSSTRTTSGRRSRRHSGEIIKQIRSLTNLEVSSPTMAKSVIREIRSLTDFEFDIDEDEEYELGPSPVAEGSPSYTPFSCSTTDKSILDNDDIQPSLGSRSSTRERLSPIPHPAAPSPDAELEVREYTPVPPIVCITTVQNGHQEQESLHNGQVLSTDDVDNVSEHSIDVKNSNPSIYNEQLTDSNQIETDRTEGNVATVSETPAYSAEEVNHNQTVGDQTASVSVGKNLESNSIEVNQAEINDIDNYIESDAIAFVAKENHDETFNIGIDRTDAFEDNEYRDEVLEPELEVLEPESTTESIPENPVATDSSPLNVRTTDELRLMTEAARYGILLKDSEREQVNGMTYNTAEARQEDTHRYVRQSSVEEAGDQEHYNGMMEDDLNMIKHSFQHFQRNQFDIVEVHAPDEHDYCEEDSTGHYRVEDSGPMYYEDCYEYRYYPHRFRLEDIPEEGTLSKDTTYLSLAPDTVDKESSSISLTAPIQREPTIDDAARDLAITALFKASCDVLTSR